MGGRGFSSSWAAAVESARIGPRSFLAFSLLIPSSIMKLPTVLLITFGSLICGAAIYVNIEADVPGATAAASSMRSDPAVHAIAVEAGSSHALRNAPADAISRPAPRSPSPIATAFRGSSEVRQFPTTEPQAAIKIPPAASVAEAARSASVRAVPAHPSRNQSPAVSTPSAATPAITTVTVPATTPVRKLPMPLAFQDFNPEATGLSERQAEMLDSLRESFIREVGGPFQNANDPAYARRWREAQPSNDAQLRLFFGSAFAEKVALEAAQADYATTQTR
jgi:hypothetical protein